MAAFPAGTREIQYFLPLSIQQHKILENDKLNITSETVSETNMARESSK
jgi:hypothetical protein